MFVIHKWIKKSYQWSNYHFLLWRTHIHFEYTKYHNVKIQYPTKSIRFGQSRHMPSNCDHQVFWNTLELRQIVQKYYRFLRGSNLRPSSCKADMITTTLRNHWESLPLNCQNILLNRLFSLQLLSSILSHIT